MNRLVNEWNWDDSLTLFTFFVTAIVIAKYDFLDHQTTNNSYISGYKHFLN